MGVIAIVREVRVNVFVEAHACDADNAADALNVPAVDADHNEMCVNVSDVPPFVHGPTDAEAAFDPPEADAIVACLRDVSPAAAAVAPAAPGSAVCNFTQQDAVANVPSSQPFTAAEANPTVNSVLLQ
jgi:hypothetical protein